MPQWSTKAICLDEHSHPATTAKAATYVDNQKSNAAAIPPAGLKSFATWCFTAGLLVAIKLKLYILNWKNFM